MARKPQIRYWPSRKGGGFFTTIKGKQVELALGPNDFPDGPTYKEAMRMWLALSEMKAGEGTNEMTVRGVVNRYREHLSTLDSPNRLRVFDRQIKSFLAAHGGIAVSQLRPHHLTTWFATKPQWRPNTRRLYMAAINKALNWGVRDGVIASNPLRHKLPEIEKEARGKEARLSVALRDALVAACPSEAMRLVVRTLRLTGARPIELRMSLVKNLIGDTIVLPWNPPKGEYRHKNAKKTKRDRVIHLPPELAEEIRRISSGRSLKDYLFLTKQGKHWENWNFEETWRRVRNNIACAAVIQQEGRDPKTVTAYTLRHSFASDWVDTGRSTSVLAQLMGTSVTMIERVYGHPDEQKMHQFYLDFLKG